MPILSTEQIEKLKQEWHDCMAAADQFKKKAWL